MILNYEQINTQVLEANKKVEGATAYIQKIFGSAYFVAIGLRIPGKTVHLYLGRGSGWEGMWNSEKNIESSIRRKDKFLEYLRRNLASSKFKDISLDTKDRIISINYERWRRENSLMFFYNARNLYFAHIYFDEKTGMMMVFRSWDSTKIEFDGRSFELFDEVGRTELKHKITGKSAEITAIDTLLKKEKKQAMANTTGGKSQKFIKRKLKNINGDLLRVEAWKDLTTLVESEQDFSTYPMKNRVFDIKINFREKDHYKRRDEVYTKIKKLKKAKRILDLRLADTKEVLNNVPSKETFKSDLKVVSPIWIQAKRKINIEIIKEKGYRVLHFNGYDIGLGETTHGNDQLRKDWAKKNDIWFHLEGDKSPHLILKLKIGVLDEKVLTVIAGVMIEYAKYTYEDAQLIYTAVKNLKGVKGSAGKVTYKKEKHLTIKALKEWREALV